MPWAISGLNVKKRWYHSPWPWVAVAAAIGLFFLVLPFVQNAFRGWNEARYLRRAETALSGGDYRSATVNLQRVLARNPRSIPAVKLAIRTSEAMKSTDVLTFRRRLDTLTDDPDNKLALVSDMLKAGDPIAAANVLNALPESHRTSARYHELAARSALARGNPADAGKHWSDAVRLAPQEGRYQLELARLRLGSRDDAERDEAMTSLEKLSATPELALEALRVLLANAANLRERSRARELADQLVANPGATFTDRVTRLTVLQRFAPSQVASALGELQTVAAADPTNTFLLLTWMNTHNQALLVPDWELQLPEATRESPQVKSALAEALARASAWQKLRARLEGESWGPMEFLRFAYLARAHERLGDENATLAGWSNALTAAQSNSRSLQILGRTAIDWGWQDRADEALWRLASQRDCPRWVVDRLWQRASAAKDTAKMLEATRLLLKADPKNLEVRNNFAALALLTGQATEDAHRVALEVHHQRRDDAIVATTYGLSLLQQNRAAEAADLMRPFPAEKLSRPIVALYYGIFLSAAGKATEAAPFLELVNVDALLPEERALMARFTGVKASAAAGTPSVAPIDRNRTDTASLYREVRQKFLEDSRDVATRINYITLAILTHQNADTVRALARTLYKEHGTIPEVVLVQALALFEERHAAEAVATMRTLGEAQLSQPLFATYLGIFLAAAGEHDAAREQLERGATAVLLPEEKALVAQARAQLAPEAGPPAARR